MTSRSAITIGGIIALLVATTLWLRHRYVIVTVEGASMRPALRDMDRVLVRRTGADAVRRGQVVVLAASPDEMLRQVIAASPVAEKGHDTFALVDPSTTTGASVVNSGPGPGRRLMIKRAAAVPGDPLPRADFPPSAMPRNPRFPPTTSSSSATTPPSPSTRGTSGTCHPNSCSASLSGA